MSSTALSASRLCVATVTTDSFVAGTLVTLHSFLRHHPAFAGDLVVIHDELAPEARHRIARLYDRVVFVAVGDVLRRRVAHLVSAVPTLAANRARFYSLETFRLRACERVLFCDSDLLFRASIDDLLVRPEPLLACGDGSYYRGNGRPWFRPGEGSTPDDGLLRDTFNAGLLVIGATLLTDEHYQSLLDLVDPRVYRGGMIAHTDQVVLNLHFAGRQQLVDAAYNYVLTHRRVIAERTRLQPRDARVLHFNGWDKPWLAPRTERPPELAFAHEEWRTAYADCSRRLQGGA